MAEPLYYLEAEPAEAARNRTPIMRNPIMFAILTGNLNAAARDAVDNSMSINRATMTGKRPNGEAVIIVSADFPERLYGIELSGFEIHPSLIGHKNRSHLVDLARSRQR